MKVPVRRYWDLLSTYLRHRWWQFAVLAVLLFGGIGLQLIVPQITRRFIDLAEAGSAYRVLLIAAVAFIGTSLAQQLLTVLARYAGETVAWSATNDLRIDLARHCLKLDMGFHTDKSPGEMIERIDGDLLEISQFFSQLVIMVFGSALLLFGILIALCIEDLRLGAAFAAFSVGTVGLFIRLRNIAVPYDKANREAISDLFGFLEERLAGTEDIRSSGAVEYVLLGLYKLHYRILKAWRKADLTHIMIRLLAGVAMSVGYGIAFVGGASLYRSGAFTLGTVYLILHYTELIARPIRILTQQFQNLQKVGANVERVNELFSITSRIGDIDTGAGGLVPPPQPETGSRLEFDHVTFSYVDDEVVLHDLSIDLSPGKTLGVLGRTGSGKTTMARLVFRLYDPQQGRVLLDGMDVRSYPLAELRGRVAMVTQDVQLFRATVRENLTFFDSSIPDSRLHEVIAELELAHWYESLPEGLDTKIDVSGKGLSAGEAQLLAFTRVFLKDPKLVILDEASSRLDPATERLIERAVDRLLVHRTALIIAHRLGTVQRADEILILEDGTVVEHGDRAELAVAEGSRFHSLLQTGLEEVLA